MVQGAGRLIFEAPVEQQECWAEGMDEQRLPMYPQPVQGAQPQAPALW